MYINLYPAKQLQRAKQSLLSLGFFLAAGGAYALVREVLLRDDFQPLWLVGAGVVTAIGIACIVLGAGWVRLKDAFFAMNPDQISYRLTLYGRERVVQWQTIESIRIIPGTVLFGLKTGKQVMLRLGLIEDENVARHIQASIRLAALQQNVSVNGVQVHKHAATYSI